VSQKESAVHFDEIGSVITAGDKRLRLSKTQFKIMQIIYKNKIAGKWTSSAQIKNVLKAGATEKALYQQMYILRKLLNDVKFFPLRLIYIRENGDKWYEWR
jgi:DNA-binding winged helix-turn-helix (wHTH) protein